MAGTAGIRAGKAYVEVTAKDSTSQAMDRIRAQFTTKLKAIQTVSKQVGDTMAGIGGALTKAGGGLLAVGTGALAGLGAMANSFADAGSVFEDASARTGVSRAALQELGYAASTVGVEFGALEGGLTRMSRVLGAAKGGSKAAAAALAAVGLSVVDLEGLSPDEAFAKIADGINAIDDPARKTAATLGIFGKSGSALIPIMANGAAGIAEMRNRARELGIVMSDKDVAAADAFGDAMGELGQQFAAVKNQIGAAIAEALQPYLGSIQKGIAGVIRWASEHRGMVVAIAAGAAGVAALGAALIGVGTTLIIAGAAVSGITTLVAAAGTAFLALLSPIGLTAAAIIAGGAALLYFTGLGRAMVDAFKSGFATLLADGRTAMAGIADALAAGNVQDAVSMLWKFIQLEWSRGISYLRELWIGFRDYFPKLFAQAGFELATIWVSVTDGIAAAWDATVAYLGDAWTSFSGFFEKLGAQMMAGLKKDMNILRGLWDKTFDADAANAGVDKGLIAKREKIDGATAAANEARGNAARAASAKRLADLGRELAVLKQAQAEKEAADKAATDAELEPGRAKIRDLEKRLAEMRAKAGMDRAASDAAAAARSNQPDPQKTGKAIADALIEGIKSAGFFGYEASAVAGTIFGETVSPPELDDEDDDKSFALPEMPSFAKAYENLPNIKTILEATKASLDAPSKQPVKESSGDGAKEQTLQVASATLASLLSTLGFIRQDLATRETIG